MRTIWVWLSATMLTMGSLHAELNEPIYCSELAGGYRQDHFQWGYNHSAHSCSSSCSSRSSSSSSTSLKKDRLFEMEWKTLRMVEVTGRFSVATCLNYYARIDGGYARTYHGEVRADSFTELHSSGSQRETGRIRGNGKNGDCSDIQACVGYQFTSNGSRAVATPVIGYAWHNQTFKMRDAKQTVDLIHCPPDIGPIQNLHVRYKPRWYGPFVGLDFLVAVDMPCTLLFGSCEWHFSNKYHAEGLWNYDDIFVNKWKDKASAHGLVGYLGFNYNLGCGWYIGVVGHYRHFQTNDGKHRPKFVQNFSPDRHSVFGTMPVVSAHHHSRMSHVHWVSWSIAATIDFRFFPF